MGSDLYMNKMHGGHGGSKTSSFKRCLFLKDIGAPKLTQLLVAAIRKRPSPFCYVHLLQGGGAVDDVSAGATAFGCRGWDFACVVTGVWRRDQEGTDYARHVVDWVYKVANKLLPLSWGVYRSDLGPDPRDAPLATRAFGLNRPRLAQLKRKADPHNILAYACPIPKLPLGPKLIVLVTGNHGAGKDYCADVWLAVLSESHIARAVSISEVVKQEYAAATGADLNRMLSDREYKEQHRPALKEFFKNQVKQRPRMCEEHFLDVVYGASGVEVLFITGTREEAPLGVFAHLVLGTRLVEVRVDTSREVRQARCGRLPDSEVPLPSSGSTFVFDNGLHGAAAVEQFARRHLLPLCGHKLQELSSMISVAPDFPKLGVDFRHILGIAQNSDGLSLCTSLLWKHLAVEREALGTTVCCEAGGFIFASPMAAQNKVPLVLISEAGKLPPPTISVSKTPSNVSSKPATDIEISAGALNGIQSVVVVDDVLATGNTLCAVLQLLRKADVAFENISVIVVAEFPILRGLERLRQLGFGDARAQSLLRLKVLSENSVRGSVGWRTH